MVGLQRDNMAALALVPEHLAAYVQAISGMEVQLCGQCPCYVGQEGEAVLVGYPLGACAQWDQQEEARVQVAVDTAVAVARRLPGVRQLTVLAPVAPTAMPKDASVERDSYWALPLPLPTPLPQKVRNMLTSARRLVHITQESGAECWTEEHRQLVHHFCAHHANLQAGSVFIFEHLEHWLTASADTHVFSARDHDGHLLASAVGDFTALDTAFYMFAFREPHCPPGVADLLLHHIALEGARLGQRLLNLGLGINGGVTFFKKKWGAVAIFPLVTSSWQIAGHNGVQKGRKSWWQRLWA